ncbi:hypothetical protein V2G26_009558 [Clonostachys chloroleuca]
MASTAHKRAPYYASCNHRLKMPRNRPRFVSLLVELARPGVEYWMTLCASNQRIMSQAIARGGGLLSGGIPPANVGVPPCFCLLPTALHTAAVPPLGGERDDGGYQPSAKLHSVTWPCISGQNCSDGFKAIES